MHRLTTLAPTDAEWLADTIARNKARFGGWSMEADPNPAPEPTSDPAPDPTDQTFTQADVDRIVKERVQREKAKYADYNDLKAKAEGAKTVEDRIAEVEQRAIAAETKALRAEIANAHGISAEDRDLFLTGADEEVLTAQAKRLADRESDRKKLGNHVPREGETPSSGKSDSLRDFTRNLFASSDD